jgi:hypothetical protein
MAIVVATTATSGGVCNQTVRFVLVFGRERSVSGRDEVFATNLVYKDVYERCTSNAICKMMLQ